MEIHSLNNFSNLTFQWMKLTGPHIQSCFLIHSHTSHAQQILHKMASTVKISKNFYFFFHLIHFLINLKRNARLGKLPKAFCKSLKNYIKSILFIAHLVGGLKLLKCTAVSLYNKFGLRIDGSIFLWGSFLSSLGIFWQGSQRRQQITYFSFVRSIRSSYIYLKRRNIICGKYQMQICFVLIYGILTYMYTAYPQNVKLTNIFLNVWGKF